MASDEGESKVNPKRKSSRKFSKKSIAKPLEIKKQAGKKSTEEESVSNIFEISKPAFKKLNKVSPLFPIPSDDNATLTEAVIESVNETENETEIPLYEDAYQPKEHPGNDLLFHSAYSPPLGHYEFYKSYEEYLALMKTYKNEGSTKQYDALRLVWQEKMKMELLQRFPWPPKLARGTFWTFGYYRDYFPPETLSKPVITPKHLKASARAFFNYDLDTEILQDEKKRTKTAANYLDSTETSTQVSTQPVSQSSIMSGATAKYNLEDENDFETLADGTRSRRKSRRKSQIKGGKRKSIAFTMDANKADPSQSIAIPEFSSDLGKTRRKSKSKGRRTTIVETTYYYSADNSGQPSTVLPDGGVLNTEEANQQNNKARRSTIVDTSPSIVWNAKSIALPDVSVDVPNAEERKKQKNKKKGKPMPVAKK